MTLTLNTDTDQQFGLSWHGDDEAARRTTSTTVLPGFGEARLRCETGKNGEQSVALRPTCAGRPGRPTWTTSTSPARGRSRTTSTTTTNSAYDPVTGLLGPVDLPSNGMMRIWWSVNGVKKAWVLSSYSITNNDRAAPAQRLRGRGGPAA